MRFNEVSMMTNWFTIPKRVLVFLSLSAALIVVTGLGGCGFKTLPVAPQALVPLPITDLRYELSEIGVTLFWSYPRQTIAGDELTEINRFVLSRAVVAVDDYCNTCPIPFGVPISLPGGVLPGEGAKTAYYESTLLRPGNLYFFQIRSKSGWMAESAPSNLVSFVWQTPPAAPTGLTADAKDSRITLSWQPVTVHLDGTPITRPVRYQVSRSHGGASYVNIGEQQSEASFADATVDNARKYRYRVQTFTVYDKDMVGGGFSDHIETSSVDQTPPAPPANVNAVRTAKGAKIYWDRGQEPDLKGYRVYRRLPGTVAEIIGEVLEPYNLHEDLTIPAGVRMIYYSVSGFDKSKPANESERSAETSMNR